MKKPELLKAKGNVVYFPGLDKRFLEKGLNLLQNKKIDESIDILQEAIHYNPDNADIHIALILAYYEKGSLNTAKYYAKNMLDENLGDYLQVIDLYLMILVQLNEYEEVVSIITEILEESSLSNDREDHYLKMLEFGSKMVERVEEELINRQTIDEKTSLINEGDEQTKLIRIANLSEKNIRLYIEEIKEFLLAEEENPFLKTILLNILKEQEYDQEINVYKFKRMLTLIPKQLKEPNEQEAFLFITEILRAEIEHDDPILYSNVQELIERHAILLYPFSFELYDSKTWAAAYHATIKMYYEDEDSFEWISEQYDVNLIDLQQTISLIKELDEISYPNI